MVGLWVALAGWSTPAASRGEPPHTRAVPARVEAIRKNWEQSQRAGYRRVVVHANPDRNEAPGVGFWDKHMTFYWDWDADSLPLVRVDIDLEIASRHIHQAYLFDVLTTDAGPIRQGPLAFALWKTDDPDDPPKRFYFEGPKLVRVILGDRTVDTVDSALAKEGNRLMRQAQSLLATFKGLVADEP